MVAIKYKINNGEWTIKLARSEFEALSVFSVSSNGLALADGIMVAILSSPVPIATIDAPHKELGSDIDFHLVGITPPTDLFGLTPTNAPEVLRNLVQESDCSVVIQRMPTEELESLRIDDFIITDIFDWLKHKISTTTNIPEGFDLPLVTDDSITIFSNAFLVVNRSEMPTPTVDISDDEDSDSTPTEFKSFPLVSHGYHSAIYNSAEEYPPEFIICYNTFKNKIGSTQYNSFPYPGIMPNEIDNLYNLSGHLVKNFSTADFMQVVQDSYNQLLTTLQEPLRANMVLEVVKKGENNVHIFIKNSELNFAYIYFGYSIQKIDIINDLYTHINPEFFGLSEHG